METNEVIIDYATKHDFRTNTDRRTIERKGIIKQVLKMKIKHYNSVYGIWCYLRIKDRANFLTFNNN